MRLLHSEPTASAFNRLLTKELGGDDHVTLVHVFEEISVLALHRLIGEDLLFDAYAFDLYWEELREDVLALRRQTANQKLGEHFALAAERAREHRRPLPTKLRWGRDDPPGGGWKGGGRGHPRPATGPDPPAAAARPARP